jgi:hypothetical protein
LEPRIKCLARVELWTKDMGQKLKYGSFFGNMFGKEKLRKW